MLGKYVSWKIFLTPKGEGNWVRLPLKSIENQSHEAVPPDTVRYARFTNAESCNLSNEHKHL